MNKPKLSAKDYLSQAYRIDQRINSKIEQVQSLRELAGKASATLSDVPPSKGNRNVHRMEDVIAKMVDLESEINADLTRLINLKHEIVTVIKRVESPELQTLLELDKPDHFGFLLDNFWFPVLTSPIPQEVGIWQRVSTVRKAFTDTPFHVLGQ